MGGDRAHRAVVGEPSNRTEAPRGTPARYLANVQALRAVAVMLVVTYHLWPTRLQGGYIGVDVFFVISGFLMTQHILRLRESSESPRALLREFYVRRVRRILPASLVVLLATALATLLLPQTMWRTYFSSTLAGALYVQNWWQVADATDYLAAAHNASPALHFWSLSVEEQFYVVWPLLLLAATSAWAYRHLRSPVLVVIGATVAVSLVYSIWVTTAFPTQAYFDTGARLWQLAAGGVVSIVTDGVRSPRGAAVLAWTGMATIGASAVLYTGETPFPGWHALLPVAGTVLVILAGNESRAFGLQRLFRTRPVRFLGNVSYSIYLWHWPLIVLLPLLLGLGHSPDLRLKLVVVILTLVLAHLTKRWVEDPLRRSSGLSGTRTGPRPVARGADRSIRVVVVLTVLVVAVAGTATGWAVRSVEQADEAFDRFLAAPPTCFGAMAHDPVDGSRCPDLRDTGEFVPQPLAASAGFRVECQQLATRSAVLNCRFGAQEPGAMRIALVGDSHATQWIPALEEPAARNRWSVTTYLRESCRWARTSDDAICAEWNTAVTGMLRERAYDWVLVSSRSLRSDREDPAALEDVADAQRAVWREITVRGSEIAVLRDVPQPGNTPVGNIPDCLQAGDDPAECAFGRGLAEEGDSTRHAAVREGLPIVDLNDLFCPGATCPAVVGNVMVYMDDNHMSVPYALSLAAPLERELREAGLRAADPP